MPRLRSSVRRKKEVEEKEVAIAGEVDSSSAADVDVPSPVSTLKEESSSSTISNYELERQQRLLQNRKMMLQLGLADARTHFRKAVAPPPSQSKRKRRSTPTPPRGPTRKSRRLSGANAEGLYLTGTKKGGKFVVGVQKGTSSSSAAADKLVRTIISEAKSSSRSSHATSRIADGPLTLDAANTASAESGAEFLSSLKELSRQAEDHLLDGDEAPVPQSSMDWAEKMSLLRIDVDHQVAKVVPDRIYGIALHPSASSVVCAVGDKKGNLGVWNYGSLPSLDEDEVADGEPRGSIMTFRPHTGAISQLSYSRSGDKLYSWSYDDTVRAMDIERSHFDHVFKRPDADGGWLQRGCISPEAPNELWVCDTQGVVSMVDLRTAHAGSKPVWAKQLSDKKINTIDVCPGSPHTIATCGLDRMVKLWDTRKRGTSSSARTTGVSKMSLATMQFDRSVSSALFSCDGGWLLTTSFCNKLNLYQNPAKGIPSSSSAKPTYSIRHDNQTGRWLTPFNATWHPTQPDVFVCGSMQRPRAIEVFHTENRGRRIMNIQGECLTSVFPRCVFHPTLQVIAGANSSGRVALIHQ